jgi:hypothetical protein
MTQQINAKAWQEDLHFLAKELPKRHDNLFHTMMRDSFETAVAELDQRIPALTRHQLIVELARIVALVGDGHSRIDLLDGPNIGFRRYPLQLYLYSDGVFIQAAGAEHAQEVGARVVAIGDTEIAQAYARAGQVISRDNEVWAKHVAPGLLVIPEVLHSLDLIRDIERATFTVELSTGDHATIELRPCAHDAPVQWIDAAAQADAPTPLWLRAPENEFWFT